MKKKIDLSMTRDEVLLIMSERNPGALRVLCEILNRGPDGLIAILHLDDMNIRGERIWLGYKDHCKESLDSFVDAAKKRDRSMVDTINKECSPSEKAVHSGASFREIK